VLEEFRGRCSGLQLEVEQQRSQAQVYADRLEDKSREIERLTEALRNVDDDVKQERERKDVLIARLRASVCFNRICIFHVMPIVFGHCRPG
jgi:chromosome segregation ATPase